MDRAQRLNIKTHHQGTQFNANVQAVILEEKY